MNGATRVIFGPREHLNIFRKQGLRKQGNGPNFGGSKCGNLENTFGTIRPLPSVQTKINMRIRICVDDITFTQTVLHDGKIKI